MPKLSKPIPAAGVLIGAIQRFLDAARDPVLLEPGACLIALNPQRVALTPSARGVRLEAWDDESTCHRRVVGMRECGGGKLELEVEKFGGKSSKLVLADRARPLYQGLQRDSSRMIFAEAFREFLCRQFMGWTIAGLTSHGDLEHSLSPSFPRAMVVEGQRAWAAIAAPAHDNADRLLTFGLIWHNYLRLRERSLFIEGLALFVPKGKSRTTCLRARWLNRNALHVAVFEYEGDGWERAIETSQGNLDTYLNHASQPEPERWRGAGNGPEWWLEQMLRDQPRLIDARLCEAPVYGQVPVVAGVERGIIDLLAATLDGRLTVMELKASQDPHLPIQALDYWMRVAWHAARAEFGQSGYFPGLALRVDPPRLILVAPSLEFHPTTEVLLGYLDPSIEVERVGLAVEWERQIRVSFRLHGTRRPC
ncbi:MAG: hypothetical protein ABI972_03190 [Acidobacteriota bacterium]